MVNGLSYTESQRFVEGGANADGFTAVSYTHLHFTFHALRHTFATRALERGMDYKTLSAILGHYSVAFTMDTYVHSMDEHKRREMDKMDDMFGMQYSISVETVSYTHLDVYKRQPQRHAIPVRPRGRWSRL